MKTICAVIALPRSSYYHKPNPPTDESLRTALLAQAEAWPTYGYRRLTVQLQRGDVKALYPPSRLPIGAGISQGYSHAPGWRDYLVSGVAIIAA